MELFSLKNKTAIVTGGSTGIGAAIALKLAELGANIAIVDWKEEANAIISEIEKFGRKAVFIRADVSKFNDAQTAVENIVKEFGKVDILVNNAGINKDGVIWKMTEEQWDNVVDVNLKGFFN
jgi:3-oxoacyl-[acyl-carrier protein] reductase